MSEIEVHGVYKRYRVRNRRPALALDFLNLLSLRGLPDREFYALKDVSFEVAKGEAFGVIGNNGSGKSTLLRILAGVAIPTHGTVRVRGTVSTMLELGAGFHQELTGRENIWLSGAMMGLSRAQIRAKLDEIIAFAELDTSIDQPIFTYSSGMQVRLGFAIAIAFDPDVLILDEVLAVGDHAFRAKSHAAILDFRERGKTIVLVSHDLHEVIGFCSRALLLNEGVPVMVEKASRVIPFYLQTTGSKGGQQYLTFGRISLAFSNGRLLLFRDALPLTQFTGFYFSFFSARNWFDSLEASWRITREWNSGMVVEGKLLKLPMTFTLGVEVHSESEVRLTLRAHVHEAFDLDQYHASLLLQSHYQRWSAPPDSGEFPPIDVASHDWTHVNARQLHGRRLEVEPAGEFPRIALIADTPGFTPTVLNTDHLGNARVLQFLALDQRRWEPGDRVLFEGTIEIDD